MREHFKILKYFIPVILFVLPKLNFAQDSVPNFKTTFSGYITNMQSAMFTSIDGDWLNDNLLHNRLNFQVNYKKHFFGNVQLRTRFFSGETVKYQSGYDSLMAADKGIISLTKNVSTGKSYLLNTTLDRAYLQFSYGKFEITAGRQRINWGQTFVWNPNDLFNNYSFFDFDYVERPGADALRIQYYSSMTSSLQLAFSENYQNKLTSGLLWRTNKWNYDFQLLCGLLNQHDAVFGLGWSGFIKSLGFRGEASYFYPVTDYKNKAEQAMVSVGLDYTFNNNVMIQSEFLYTQIPKSNQITNFESFYYQPLSVKNLSFTEYNLFLQTTIPITPLLKFSASGMYMPGVNGFYVGPSFEYSLSDNLSWSFILQKFYMELDTQQNYTQKVNLTLAFMRIKLNF